MYNTNMWIHRKVQHGTKTGRKIGFPTLNLTVGNFACPDRSIGDNSFDNGVYACQVRINGQIYKGALYLGPGFKKHKKVLEIFVIDFNKKIYGQFVSFKVGKQIRGAKKFDDLDSLKKQIKEDLEKI